MYLKADASCGWKFIGATSHMSLAPYGFPHGAAKDREGGRICCESH